MTECIYRCFLASILAFLVVLPFPVRAEESHLPIVFEDYPPYEFVEEGAVRGINMDLIREAFRRMGIKPYFEPRPWKRAIFQLKSGEILALSSGFKTKERLKFALFPSVPLSMETNMIVVRADRDIKIESLDDLKVLTLGVVREYSYGELFDSYRGLFKIEAQSSHQLLRMLLNGRMDAAIGNKAVFRYLAKKQGKLDQIKFIYEVGSDPLYLMFSKARGARAETLARDFESTMKGMVEDGSFAEIVDSY